jgi:hypothetical protein
MPEWVVPTFDEVVAVRRSAVAALRKANGLGTVRALDWVASVEPVTPLTGFRDAPAMPRVLAERLCAWESLTGRPVADADYERLGYEPLAPDEALMDREYAGGVWHALAWLLGEEREPPSVLYQARRAAG